MSSRAFEANNIRVLGPLVHIRKPTLMKLDCIVSKKLPFITCWHQDIFDIDPNSHNCSNLTTTFTISARTLSTKVTTPTLLPCNSYCTTLAPIYVASNYFLYFCFFFPFILFHALPTPSHTFLTLPSTTAIGGFTPMKPLLHNVGGD